MGGPSGAFLVVAGIVAAHGVDGLFMYTVMAGTLLVIMGATGMGSAVKYVPRPIVIGFTNGIAILIASTQIKDFFGLGVEKVPGVFWLRMETSATHFWTVNFEATALAVATVAILIACRMISNQVPGSIVELAFGTAAVFVFQLPVETMGTRLGGIPNG
jgi:sulfate permease, SulP family